MKTHHTLGLILLAALIFTALQAVYIVDQRQQAIVLQLGHPVGGLKNPGLHFKTPLLQDVLRFDRRVLAVDPPPAQMVISSGAETDQTAAADPSMASGEPIIVDTFARYRITDPLQFLKSLRTLDAAEHRLEGIVNDATRATLGKTTLTQLLSKDRNAVMQEILMRVNARAKDDKLGIAILDIRIVRADLTPELRQSTVRRMISELKERATQTRAEGEQKALEIRSTAEKERTVLLANASRDAAVLEGEGDQQAFRLYAAAYNKDKDFYAFWRSLEAYRTSLATPDTRLILAPDSGFLRIFRNGPDAK